MTIEAERAKERPACSSLRPWARALRLEAHQLSEGPRRLDRIHEAREVDPA